MEFNLNSYGKFNDYDIFLCSGQDVPYFLQGQTTADLTKLKTGEFCLNTRLKRTGQLVAYFYTAKCQDDYYLFVPNQFSELLIADLDKFIIMEDVDITKIHDELLFTLSPLLMKGEIKSSFHGEIFGEEGQFFWGQSNTFLNDLEEYNAEEIKRILILNGHKEIYKPFRDNILINETIFNSSAISYTKGCFLGSETVSKIENGRGGAYFPMLLVSTGINQIRPEQNANILKDGIKIGTIEDVLLEDDALLICSKIFRQNRILGQKIKVEIESHSYECIIHSFPYRKNRSWANKSIALYDLAMDEFVNDKEELAKNYLKDSIIYNPQNADACESLGVIYGRQNEYEKALELMDKLLEADPGSVMAHTNKSLYLMNLGRIEEAEDEKSKATVKTFEKFGTEAELKEIEEKSILAEKQKSTKRQNMYLEVLEIDSEDFTANLGLADLEFKNLNYEKSLVYLSQITQKESDNADFCNLSGMNYNALKNNDEAIKFFSRGVQLASSKGNMKLASSIQIALQNIMDEKSKQDQL